MLGGGGRVAHRDGLALAVAAGAAFFGAAQREPLAPGAGEPDEGVLVEPAQAVGFEGDDGAPGHNAGVAQALAALVVAAQPEQGPDNQAEMGEGEQAGQQVVHRADGLGASGLGASGLGGGRDAAAI